MKKTPSLNDRLSKTFSSLKQAMTSLNLHRNGLLTDKIKTEYFTDVRYGKMIRMMDECMAEMEQIVGDMRGMKEKFVLARDVHRSGDARAEGGRHQTETGDGAEGTAVAQKRMNEGLPKRRRRVVMRRKGRKLRERNPNIK